MICLNSLLFLYVFFCLWCVSVGWLVLVVVVLVVVLFMWGVFMCVFCF